MVQHFIEEVEVFLEDEINLSLMGLCLYGIKIRIETPVSVVMQQS
jgi:hypothetical protein